MDILFSIIAFLVLWNLQLSNKVYAILIIPFICLVLGIVTIKYQNFIDNIPVVNEHITDLYKYEPFADNDLLAKLDKKENLELIDDLPIYFTQRGW